MNDDITDTPMSNAKLATMRPLAEVLPDLATALKKRGRPAIEAPKERITIRLDTDILQWLKSSGRGYQTRINDMLRDLMEQQRK